MLLMKKDNELYLFPDYDLSYMVDKGYTLLNLVKLNSVSSAHPVSKGRRVVDYINNQKRLLKQLEDEYKRKSKARKNALKILEGLKNGSYI